MLPEKPVMLSSTDPNTAARAFFAKYGADLGGTGSDKELAPVAVNEPDADGITYARYQHVAPTSGLPVFDETTTAAFTPKGELLYVQTGFHAGIDAIVPSPKLDAAAANAAALAAIAARCGEVEAGEDGKPTLGIASHDGVRLAYRIPSSAHGERCHSPEVTLDAATGEVLAFSSGVNGIIDANAKGVHYHAKSNQADVKSIDYSLTSDGRRVLQAPALRSSTEGWLPQISTKAYKAFQVETDIEAKELGAWDDASPKKGAAVDAHYHAARAFDFFRDVLQRRGIDNEGHLDLLVVVHDNTSSGGMNAWKYGRTGTTYKRGSTEVISIGDGDLAEGWLPVTGYDVLVHELSHGITAHSSNLIYAGESGALNESFSDVMAASADSWIAAQQKPEQKRLTVPGVPTRIGETVTVDGKGFRNLENPQEFGNPDYYPDRFQCAPGQKPNDANDQCGVHDNSGIANRAWSLMALGGIHSRTGVRVNGMGWKTAASLWYNTFTHLVPTSNMRAAAQLMVARSLYYGPEALIATACAWHAVGVGDFRYSSFNTTMCAKVAAATPKVTASSCSGVTFGYVCQDNALNSAYVCVNGSTASAVYCKDLAKRCKSRSGTDWSATYDIVNGLACE